MSNLPPSTLTQLRRENERWMPDSGTLLARSTTMSASGGSQEVYTESGTVPCQMLPERAGEAEFGSQTRDQRPHRFTAPYDTTLNSGDRVSVGGKTYSVQNILDWGEDAVAFRAVCYEVVT